MKTFGVESPKFKITLPFSQISQTMFFLAPCLFLFKDSLRKKLLNAYVFLIFGISFVGVTTPLIVHYFYDYTSIPLRFLFDIISHLLTGLFGIYLILSKQADLSFKSLLKSYLFMVVIINICFIINVIFRTNMFGLSPYENWNTYDIHLPYFILNYLLLHAGLFIVMSVPYLIYKIKLKMETKKRN